MKTLLLTFALIFPLISCSAQTKSKSEPMVFIGTYTQNLGWVKGQGAGIYRALLDEKTGKLTVVDSTTGIENPSFLTYSPDKKYLYSVGELAGSGSQRLGKVVAYKITEGYKLLKINELPSYGNAPCSITTDRTGRFVYVANYSTGNIVGYRVQSDGSLSDSIQMIQHAATQPHAHMVLPSPDNRFLFAVDKGADKIFAYTIEKDGRLTRAATLGTVAGAGPRHLSFNPKNSARFCVINENNSTLLSCSFDAKTMTLNVLDMASTLPKDFNGKNTCADIHIHPSGRFVYGSNRGHNSIVVFALNPTTGKLNLVGHTPTQGEMPRNFMLTPNGNLLLAANQNSSTVVAFNINSKTGKLTPTGVTNNISTPVCLKWVRF